jgi:hypothetical protein
MRWILAGLAPAIGFMGTGFAPPLVAGIPNRCDMARIAARGAILSRYEQLVSELDRRISMAKANGKDPVQLAVADARGKTRSVNLISLTAELGTQEQRDLGHADRQVSKDCASDGNAVESAKRTAESVAALGISAIMSKHGISDTDLLLRALPSS